jgi:hypothetical protein
LSARVSEALGRLPRISAEDDEARLQEWGFGVSSTEKALGDAVSKPKYGVER